MKPQSNVTTRNPIQSVTRRSALKTIGASLAGLALARLGVNQAQAIVNGTLDGNAHPNVGGFVWLKSFWPPAAAPLVTGSGILIHPRVVLTAGHGTFLVESLIAGGSFTLDDLLVSFASDASDPGTWRTLSHVITHPDYSLSPAGMGNMAIADVGVAILSEPVTGIPPVPLPALGFLDSVEAAGGLKAGSDRTKFTVIGYGVDPGDANFGHLPFPPDGKRRVTQSEFQVLHDRWLFVDQNVAHDNGGTCTGDSGGPTFWVDPLTDEPTLVAIASRGNLSHSVRYRVDTEEALTFLHDVIARVEAGEL